MEYTVLCEAETEPGVIEVCPIHGCVYDERGVCEMCEEDNAMPIWKDPRDIIRGIMETVPGGTFRNGNTKKD